MFERPRGGERAVLVRIGLNAPVRAEDLTEFEQLAEAAGAQVVATITGRSLSSNPPAPSSSWGGMRKLRRM